MLLTIVCLTSRTPQIVSDGTIVGNIEAERLRLRRSALVIGNVTCQSLSVDPDVSINGKLNVHKEAPEKLRVDGEELPEEDNSSKDSKSRDTERERRTKEDENKSSGGSSKKDGNSKKDSGSSDKDGRASQKDDRGKEDSAKKRTKDGGSSDSSKSKTSSK